MKLFFISVFITLIKFTFCSKDKGKYLKLNKSDEEAYLVAKNCEEVYICYKHTKENWILGGDILEKYENSFNNPDKCSIKRYTYVSTDACFMSSTGKNKIIKGFTSVQLLPYYDIDIINNRVLTEMGWCIHSYEIIDSNWLSYIDDDLRINQINIPGTHDTGTYNIVKIWYKDSSVSVSNLAVVIVEASLKTYTAQTQDLSITEQLENGIRYLDIRLALDSENSPFYLCHGPFVCYDNNGQQYLYFKSVIKYCIDFLNEHKKETIILHLKRENISKKIEDKSIGILIKLIGKQMYSKDKRYLDYFYVPNSIDDNYTNAINQLLVKYEVELFSYQDLNFIIMIKVFNQLIQKTILQQKKESAIGFYRDIKDKGNCKDDPFDKYKDICEPMVKKNFRCQDDYKLTPKLKWLVVADSLLDDNKFNYKYDNYLAHTLNFMNVAFTNTFPNSISLAAKYMNKHLTDFLKANQVINEWFVLDFPSINEYLNILLYKKIIFVLFSLVL
ncbi:PLC-like phosphodiesterase [Piromyces finnis]|uniref:PLC-like phosphodiesterase n=1 Tax=Piromyces finnis TaxID=1754191 RepID=A0A1Y1V3R7_9FUNG|nr:PLC-like phosphodiesterase [Piromyces finnis]|eukprot:ORX46612.1 PLC-like phosphodiesterase [Piromyces finnis]